MNFNDHCLLLIALFLLGYWFLLAPEEELLPGLDKNQTRILKALYRHNITLDGVTLAREAEISTVVSLLRATEDLKKKGLISSIEGEATEERGWRPKNYYNITREGRTLVEKAEEDACIPQ